ncbi:interferon-induced GTP-binding protein Mx3 [Apiospora hydei]|uniref:Interferon-induced GTP-binding protein Mx3 n=1 Tax=Apiospora hydei TaxID=1337664 RepID=A0ABR1WS30_9PEZI
MDNQHFVVKREHGSPQAPSEKASGIMRAAPSLAPPSMRSMPQASTVGPTRSQFHRSDAPPASTVNGHATRSQFHRSEAPSYETRESEADPLMMEMRVRQSVRDESVPSSHDDMQQSFTHRSFTDIGMKLKACNDTVGELQQLGIQHVAELPELVMVGDQSSGKSSLMSGLAALNLPRSGGVCTRCPIHIRLSRNREPVWQCTVSLQLDYDYCPTGPIKKSDVTKANPFPPWVKKPHRESRSFKTIFDKAEIEEVLRWAQVAILNHSRNSELFVPGEGAYAKETTLEQAATETEAQFSPNIVALEVKGPSLPDLSFTISPVKEEDEYIVQVVKNLTSHYVRRERAIIMWALPMNHDPENSISLGDNPRCKTDLIQDSASWLAILRGEKHTVGQGYFITSRPPDEALESAAQWEQHFFHTGPSDWPNEFEHFQGRCGVELLTKFISRRLSDAFTDSLPSIKLKINERLREVRNRLSELPELPHNVEHEVKSSLLRFYSDVKDGIKENGFLSEWNALNKQFQACLLKMKPTCLVKDDDPPPVIDLNMSDDDTSSVTMADTPSNRKRARPSDSTIRGTPSKRSRAGAVDMSPIKPENDWPRASQSMRATPMLTPPVPNEDQSPFRQFYNLGRQGLSIVSIRHEIQRCQTPGMPPDVIPQNVYDPLIQKAIRNWQPALDMYKQHTVALYENVIYRALETSMSSFIRRNIYATSREHLKSFIAENEQRQAGRLTDLYWAEMEGMFVTDEENYTRYKEQEELVLRRARNMNRLRVAGFAWDVQNGNSEEDRAKQNDFIRKHLPRLGDDPYAAEIKVAAVVRGYYIAAAMHFMRSVAISMNANLLKPIARRSLDLFLDEKLQISEAGRDDSIYAQLMEEDDMIAVQRTQLRREMNKLTQAIDSINQLEISGGGARRPFYNGGALGSDMADMEVDSIMGDEV